MTDHADPYPVLIVPMTAAATVEQAEKLRDELERRLPGYTVLVAACSGSPTVIPAPENSPPR